MRPWVSEGRAQSPFPFPTHLPQAVIDVLAPPVVAYGGAVVGYTPINMDQALACYQESPMCDTLADAMVW